MKQTRIAAVLGFALAATSVVLAPSASAAPGPLAGTWTSVDTDGSNQTLDVRGSGAHSYGMTYVDDVATQACGGGVAAVTGAGVVDGNLLMLTGALTCRPGGNVAPGVIVIGYVYDAATDTLTDDFDVVWHRA